MAPDMEEAGRSSPGAELGLEARPALYDGLPGYGEESRAGLIVQGVRQDGPAARAGMRAGDVLLRIDGNLLFSRDDLRDFLAVSRPGREVTLRFVRDEGEQMARVTLGQAADLPGERAFPWRYAGLAQLDEALKQAEREGGKVLVGLSGSDT